MTEIGFTYPFIYLPGNLIVIALNNETIYVFFPLIFKYYVVRINTRCTLMINVAPNKVGNIDEIPFGPFIKIDQ